MLAAGLFEYNFGDSEFLMLFLVLSRCRSPPTGPTCRLGRMTLPALDAARAPATLVCTFRRPPRPRRRRRDARPVHRRPVTRISPEAPVPIVQLRSEDARIGGAANVAHNIAALGARVDAGRARRRRRGGGHAARRCSSRTASRADGLVERQVAARRREGAHRHRSQSAGRAHRLRGRSRRDRATAEARLVERASALGTRRRRHARLGLPEGRHHRAG